MFTKIYWKHSTNYNYILKVIEQRHRLLFVRFVDHYNYITVSIESTIMWADTAIMKPEVVFGNRLFRLGILFKQL